ncbi:MAG TPA: DUF4388 domain-containing protein [Vicinamibacteria bacterium]|nr:DUF4388 domain-containing protein [Vicinamibacteria bacterium]
MAFQGSLAELHLPDIIQLISVSGKTGVFHLVDGNLRGQIFLHDGQIVHAQLEDAIGEEAVYSLAIWSRGDFKFEPGVATEHRTISRSNTNLLMEAARRLDEWRVLSKKIPSTEMMPEFVVQENREGQINLNTSEWLILSKIDGNRSIKQIAHASGLSVFDAAKILYGLIATGLIRLKDAGASGAAPAAPMPRVTSTPRAPAPQAAPEMIARLNRVRDVCNGLLGSVGESVVNKHYLKAKAELDRGAGSEVIDEAIQQIARAASILKGPQTSEQLLEQLKALR